MKTPTTALSEVIKINYGKALKKNDREEAGPWDVFGSSGKVGSHSKCLSEKPTIIIGRKGSVGEITYAPNGGWTIDTAFYIELLNSDVDLRYLYYSLKNLGLAKHSITTSIPGINRNDIYATKIPLPPLSEQKRIAAILDKADAIRRKRQQAIELTEQFLRSTFLDMFGDPVTNPKGWEVKPIRALCDLVRGSSPRPKSDPRFYGGPVPRLMVADITRDGWLVTPQIDSLTLEGAKKSRPVSRGTIVMAVSGNVGLMSELAVDACVHDGFVAFTNLKNELVLPKFLMLTLHLLKATHDSRKAGAIFQNLTTTDIKNLCLPLPNVFDQSRFIEIFEKMKCSQEKLVKLIESSDHLFNSLVQRAFRGEL